MQKKTNTGQQFFTEVERAVDASSEEAKRPAGMPPLGLIQTETRRLGYPDSDAEFIYDRWLATGFKDGCNRRFKDWRAAIRTWAKCRYLPSQKVMTPKPGELMTNEILDALAQNPAYKKVDVHGEAWKFKHWCEQNDKPKLVTSFIKSLNAKL
jgi:hypothetical protein